MSDIQLAINAIFNKQNQTARFVNYYEGIHDLNYATGNYSNTFGNILASMRENLCPIVVDAPADRMEIINFSSGSAEKTTARRAWGIWQREMMELESANVHRNAFKCGDAYLLVWRDGNNKSVFYAQDSDKCAVVYDDENKRPLFGAKIWQVDKRLRLTVYYADRFEKYITRDKYRGGVSGLKEESFVPFSSDTEQAIETNDYGTVPMFHFYAEPVLKDAIPVQDRLNKTICDELVAQEFGAYPQRYATGLEPPTDTLTGKKTIPFKAGLDRIWMTSGTDVRFGQFQTADLTQFITVEDAARLSIARVTGTPLHFFSFTTSDAMSGEALKTLEARFTKRVMRTCLSFGAVWGKAMRFALEIEGVRVKVI